MKTKIFITILTSFSLMATLTSCEGKYANEVLPAKEMLRVLDGVIEIKSDVEETVVNVTADCHWKVDSLDTGDFGSSLTLQPREGVGDGVLAGALDELQKGVERQQQQRRVPGGDHHQTGVSVLAAPLAGQRDTALRIERMLEFAEKKPRESRLFLIAHIFP